MDLDGTLCHDNDALPGAVDFVRTMQQAGKIVGVISNSGSGPLRVQMRLHGMGISVDASRIYTAAAHTADYVLEHFSESRLKRRGRLFNLSTSAVQEMLDGKVNWVSTGGEPCDGVLVAAPTSQYWSVDRQRIALQLARNGASLIGLCADRVFPSARGIEFGSGCITTMLAYAANTTPIFCGKPQPNFFLDFCRHLEVAPHECVLIGDNLEADIVGGEAVGIRGIITLTGVTRRRDLLNIDKTKAPLEVIEDLSVLL